MFDVANFVSWLFYAGALFGAGISLAVIVIFRKTLWMVGGHLGIGFGVALFCLGCGIILSNLTPTNSVLIGMGVACSTGGFAVWLFSRRRAHEVSRFLQAADRAEEKLRSQR